MLQRKSSTHHSSVPACAGHSVDPSIEATVARRKDVGAW